MKKNNRMIVALSILFVCFVPAKGELSFIDKTKKWFQEQAMAIDAEWSKNPGEIKGIGDTFTCITSAFCIYRLLRDSSTSTRNLGALAGGLLPAILVEAQTAKKKDVFRIILLMDIICFFLCIRSK